MITPASVALSDAPGGLHQALTLLSNANVNVEYMYAFLGGKKGGAYMIFRVADNEKACSALSAQGIRLVDEDELTNI